MIVGICWYNYRLGARGLRSHWACPASLVALLILCHMQSESDYGPRFPIFPYYRDHCKSRQYNYGVGTLHIHIGKESPRIGDV